MAKRSKSRSRSRSRSRAKRLAKKFVGSLNSRVKELSRNLRRLRREKERQIILRARSPTPRIRFFRTPVRIVYRTPQYRARSPVHIHHHHGAQRPRTPKPKTPAAPWAPTTPNTTPSLRRKMMILQGQGLLTPGPLDDAAVRAYRAKLR